MAHPALFPPAQTDAPLLGSPKGIVSSPSSSERRRGPRAYLALISRARAHLPVASLWTLSHRVSACFSLTNVRWNGANPLTGRRPRGPSTRSSSLVRSRVGARLPPCPRLIGSLWGDWWGDSRGGERPLLACHAVYVEHGPPSPSRQLTSDATDDRGRGATGDARSVFAVDVHQGVPGQQAAAAGVGPVRAVHEPGLQQALRLVRWPSSPMSNPGATDMPPGRCTRACASAMALRSTRACLSKSLPRRSRATRSWA